jgi:DNA-binding MarR family transcriptional regulator
MKNEKSLEQVLKLFIKEQNFHDPPLSQLIVTAFSHTADVLNDYLDNYFNQFSPLNRTGFNLLQILISNEGHMTQTELAKHLYRSRYTITKTVDLLENNGWVKRKQIGKDRRVNNVTITVKGLQIIERSLAGMQEMSEQAISCLNKDERKELRSINKKLRNQVYSLIEQVDVQVRY